MRSIDQIMNKIRLPSFSGITLYYGAFLTMIPWYYNLSLRLLCQSHSKFKLDLLEQFGPILLKD